MVIGNRRGLFKELMALLGWIIGLIAANTNADSMEELLPPEITGYLPRVIVAFTLIFLSVRLLMILFMMTLNETISKNTKLDAMDLGLGTFVGLLRGIFMVMGIVVICGLTSIPQQNFWKYAVFSKPVEAVVEKFKPLMPDYIAEHIRF
jgi:membrane protein required for colicin V production